MPVITADQLRLWSCVCWCAILVPCLYVFVRYENTPGETAMVVASWPTSSTLPKAKGELNLVVFLHPKCPCSTATVRNVFEEVRPESVVFVLVLPTGADASFADGRIRRLLEEEYDQNPVVDIDGREAHLFGAKTSGHAFLFDVEGRLQFSGGVTAARGHVGFSAGSAFMRSHYECPTSDMPSSFPTYGCPLHNPTEAKRRDVTNVNR